MNCESESRSPVLRFLDSFLQDRNIVWMLGIGTAIFVGSSLFLVARHWAEATPLWKYGILLTYTCGVYGAGEFARRRLALRRTATVLQALTILLLPITFVALWGWNQSNRHFFLHGLVGCVGSPSFATRPIIVNERPQC